MTVKNYIYCGSDLDSNNLYEYADILDLRVARYAQQIDPSKIQPINHSQTEIQADPNKYYDVGEVNKGFKVGPDSPPQVVPLKDSSGATHNVLLLHGSKDGQFMIDGPGGALQPVDKIRFDDWRRSKGYLSYPWISCFNGNVSNTGNMNRLLKGTSQFEISTALLPDNTTHLLIKSTT